MRAPCITICRSNRRKMGPFVIPVYLGLFHSEGVDRSAARTPGITHEPPRNSHIQLTSAGSTHSFSPLSVLGKMPYELWEG